MTVLDAEAAERRAKPVARRILPPPVTGQELVLVGVIAVLWVLLGIFTPVVPQPVVDPAAAGLVAPLALIGVGMTFIIITAGIDVSVGGAIALCAVVTAKLLVNFDVPLIVAVATSMLLGLVARADQRHPHRLRPGSRDHHHLRHGEHLPVLRAAGVRLVDGEQHPGDARRLRPG